MSVAPSNEFSSRVPAALKGDPLVEATLAELTRLRLFERRAAMLDCMKSGRAKPYLHAVETEKMANLTHADVIADIGGPAERLGTLYVHLPFCTKRCSWCHYYKEINVEGAVIESFPAAVVQELAMVLERYHRDKAYAATVHYGGGTPSLLSIAQWSDLFGRMERLVRMDPGDEVAIESDPEDLTFEKAQFWHQNGVNRVSLGIQSFDDEVLKLLKRTHDAATAARSVESTMRSGIENVNVDLMYAMPGRSIESWVHDVRKTLELEADSMNIYATRPDPADSLEKVQMFPDDDERIFCQLLAHVAATQAGYEQYAPNQWIRDSKGACHAKRARNRCEDVVGVGPQAHSIIKNWFFVNNLKLDAYMETVPRGQLPPLRGAALSPDEEKIRFIQFGIKLSGVGKVPADNGVILRDYQQRFGEPIEQRFGDQIRFLKDAGVIDVDEESLHLTDSGVFLTRHVVKFFKMALEEKLKPAQPESPVRLRVAE
jgi:oxygen-independent coproporphyrinogen-3 oxidase